MLRRSGAALAAGLRAAAAPGRAQQLSSSAAGAQQAPGGKAAAAGAGAAAGLPRPITPKTAEQLSPEELQAALPSMLFTTSNVVLSTLAATAVAGVGLISVFWFASFIKDTAAAVKQQQQQPPPPPPPPKTLRQLIQERQAELEAELAEVAALPRTREVKARLAELRSELALLRPSRPWWRGWRPAAHSSSSSSSSQDPGAAPAAA